MRYRKEQMRRGNLKQTLLTLFLLIVGCFFLILFLDWAINKLNPPNSHIHSTDKTLTILTKSDTTNPTQIPDYYFKIPDNLKHLPPDSKEIISILPNKLKSERLQQLFLYKFNNNLIERIKNPTQKKTPSDYDSARLMSEVYKEYNEPINFIQVGACDGDFSQANDPIQKLIRETHWHGVMMEPVPFLFGKLTENIKHLPEHEKRIHLLNAALSNVNGKQDFYIVNSKFAEELPHETHALKYQISSFDKGHITKHLIKKTLKEPMDNYIDIIKVDSMTPDVVVNNFINSNIAVRDGNIDILLIDAEGYDLEVLKSFMKIPNLRPPIVIYETLHFKGDQKQQARKLLKSFGYTVLESGWNSFGVRVAQFD